jgi:hypothetical protein
MGDVTYDLKGIRHAIKLDRFSMELKRYPCKEL